MKNSHREYFDCACSDSKHILGVVFDRDDDDFVMEILIDISMNSDLSAWKRLKNAVKYLFKRETSIVFDRFELKQEDVARLKKLLQAYERACKSKKKG